ncbi:MAG: FtsX-like permease family protein [Simkaniaceae bacterium]|nr:FtsX-like permease family protein [Simkaniaceae bacterium]
MLFELSIAKKYLIPRRKNLSASLIALMSVVVIALVVWLVLVFLSVTEGMERNWLKQVTAFNAPVKITPTRAYYDSYYYRVDGCSEASGFLHKTIGEKKRAERTDPYDPRVDPALPPSYIRDREASDVPKDLVKEAFTIIDTASGGLEADDYEVGGALFKAFAVDSSGQTDDFGHVTQASYVGSLSENDTSFFRLIDPPRTEDLNHLLRLAYAGEGSSGPAWISHIRPREVRVTSHTLSPLFSLLPEKGEVHVTALIREETVTALTLSRTSLHTLHGERKEGIIVKRGEELLFTDNRKDYALSPSVPLLTDAPLSMTVTGPVTFDSDEPTIPVRSTLRHALFAGEIPLKEVEITKASPVTLFSTPPETLPPWVCRVAGRTRLPEGRSHAVIVPKALRTHGIKIGDPGYLSYETSLTGSMHEERLPITVAGFYDPGIMAVGARMILTDKETVRTLNSNAPSFGDNIVENGIRIFCPDIEKTGALSQTLRCSFRDAGILPYWNITPYYEYPFIKPLLQQFQSDKYLFTLIGAIVLIVACSNIISLLALLVNDKKKEIAILSAMGTSKRRIAVIFIYCSLIMGGLGTLFGISAAFLTLHNIDHVVRFLSFLQGHDAFHTAFYGKSLPDTLSRSTLIFTLIATPSVSFVAGLVPALRACRMHPSKTLREE